MWGRGNCALPSIPMIPLFLGKSFSESLCLASAFGGLSVVSAHGQSCWLMLSCGVSTCLLFFLPLVDQQASFDCLLCSLLSAGNPAGIEEKVRGHQHLSFLLSTLNS